jgi:Mn2+/Fe2+ NRAMP family transporter
VIAVSTLVGVALAFNDVDPIRELFWCAILNGVISVPIMAVMMKLAVRPDVMGSFVITRRLKALGWLCTGVMAVAVTAMLVASIW